MKDYRITKEQGQITCTVDGQRLKPKTNPNTQKEDIFFTVLSEVIGPDEAGLFAGYFADEPRADWTSDEIKGWRDALRALFPTNDEREVTALGSGKLPKFD